MRALSGFIMRVGEFVGLRVWYEGESGETKGK